ncbi:MAG: heme anaerobic degradation radical SAM methyltransferase ChuW/HutW [Deltaproteobacteria bacterium]|nr:MAG: heme anaerobic degradation radical SAM methyltransferase ChuW/HutW [Deltaproteobacteria bacterium]
MTAIDLKPYFAKTGDPLTGAFEKKITTHPGGSATMVPPPLIEKTLPTLRATARKGKSAAYIHIPFCETHCLYCGFYKKRYNAEESHAFADTLIAELEMWKDDPVQKSAPIHAVYLGGGTPTSIEAVDIGRILAAVRKNLPLANDCEVTVEGRIQKFDEEKVAACIDNGANRFSIGVQTFDTQLRQSMQRLADRETVIKKLEQLRDLDQAVLVIDLIYGFPGQTWEMWQHDIETLQSLEIDGGDLYQLQVFPKTPLQKAIQNKKMEEALDVPTRARLYDFGCDLMEKAQYHRLSVNHWGRTTRERNIYNHLMRSPAHCIPFGPGAGGNVCGFSLMTDSDYDGWKNAIAEGRKPVKMMFKEGPYGKLEKTITGEFELCRINPVIIGNRFDLDLAKCLQPLFEQWTEAGLLSREEEWLHLTRAGQFWQVNLSQLTLNYLQQTLLKEKNNEQENR